MSDPKLTVLAGGVGAARFLEGLVQVVPPETITAVVNTGDDAEFYGLYVSPDLDIVTYTLAGLVHPKQGWGLAGDTFNCLSALGSLGNPVWFNVGDKDFATHIHRTLRMREGRTLAEVTDEIRTALGVKIKIIPMTNEPVRTIIDNGVELLPFQEYFVKRRAQDTVRKIVLEGTERAAPAPGVLEAIETCDAVIIAPSNPFVSIGTIFSVPGIRQAVIVKAGKSFPDKEPVLAISPVVGGEAIKGPAADMMESLGHDVSSVGVARLYRDLVNIFVIDDKDADCKERIEELGMTVAVTETVMDSLQKKKSLAEFVLHRAFGGKSP